MDSILEQAVPGASIGQCKNFLEQPDGQIKSIIPTKNAVIVQLFNGKKVVSIECVDESEYSELQELAKAIVNGKYKT